MAMAVTMPAGTVANTPLDDPPAGQTAAPPASRETPSRPPFAHDLAESMVPLQIWWSTRDQIVVNQAGESGLLYRAIKRLNPNAPVTQVVGSWNHSAEMYAFTRLPIVLARMGLVRLAATGTNI